MFLPLHNIGEAFASVNFLYLFPAMALYFLSVYARSSRWRFILHPLIGHTRRALYPVVVVGYMANNLLPVRLGELVRAYYVSLREPVSPAAAFGTVAAERAADVATLLLMIAAVWLFIPTSGLTDIIGSNVPGGIPILVTLSIMPVLIVVSIVTLVGLTSEEAIVASISRLMPILPLKLRPPILNTAARLLTGLTVLRSPKTLISVVILSLPVWLLEAGMILLIALGFDIDNSLNHTGEFVAVILLFTAIANLAGILPATAGGLGPFEFFGALTLTSVGIPEAEAGIFVLTAHIALLLPVTVLGFVVLLLDRVSLGTLIKNSRLFNTRRNNKNREETPESQA